MEQPIAAPAPAATPPQQGVQGGDPQGSPPPGTANVHDMQHGAQETPEAPQQVEGQEGQQQPELTPEQWIELETGSRYRSVDDLRRGAEEKDRFIQQLLRERNQTPQPPPQPQVDPKAQEMAEFDSMVQEVAQDLRSDPEFADFSQAQITAEARIQARMLMKQQKILQDTLSRQEQEARAKATQAEYKSFIDANWDDFNGPIGQEIFDRARAEGRPFTSPYDHLNAVHAEMFRRGMQPTRPSHQPAGTTYGVEGAVQNGHRPLFGDASGTAAPTQPPVPPHVQTALETAQRAGVTDPERLERIKSTAMNMNMNRFTKGGFRR